MRVDERHDAASDAVGQAGSDEVEINLLDGIRRVVRGPKTILLYALAGLLLSGAIAFLLPKTYRAEAVFLPPTSTESVTQATSIFTKQDPSDLYLGMLSSRSVADYVVDEVGLMNVFHSKTRTDARVQLQRTSKFDVSKNSLIMVDITTGDAKLSASIANAYLDALYELNGAMVASASLHRSQFFEQQLEKEKNALEDAEVDLKRNQEQSGVVLPEGEAQAGLSATARLQASIEQEETQLSELLTGSTEQNPQVIQLRARIAELRAQLARQARSATAGVGGGLSSTEHLPAVMLDYVRKQREVRHREALYESLTQQYEKARLAAIDPGPQLQIVDRAIVPEQKSGPPRKLIVEAGVFLGIVLGLTHLLFAVPLRRMVRSVVSTPQRPAVSPGR